MSPQKYQESLDTEFENMGTKPNMGNVLERFRINKHNAVIFIFALLLIIAGIYRPQFVEISNLFTMFRQAASLGIMTIGQLFAIIGGGLDLSVAATLQMSITIFMWGYNHFGLPGLYIGIAAAFLFGILVGLTNGVIVAKYKVQPFLATLFTGSIITGIRMILVGIESAGNVPDVIRVFGRGRTLTIPNGLIIFFIIACIAAFVMNRSVYGRKLVAVGTNYIAAEFSGIKADNIVIMSYIICSTMSIIASILLAGYIGFADRWIGAGMHFNSLVAAVLGGNYFGGGRGSVLGAVGGALVMTIVINFVTLLGFSAPFQHVVAGGVLILTLFIGTYSKKSQPATT